MDIMFRQYTTQWGCTPDYEEVRAFLIKRGECEYTYARWDWMATHSCLQRENVRRIGLWEDNDQLVGLATFDCSLGEVFLITLPGYDFLKEEMLDYARQSLCGPNGMELVVRDDDGEAQRLFRARGYVPTGDCEWDMLLEPSGAHPTLPEGFSLTDMRQRYDPFQYGRVLWKGFNHELDGEGAFEETVASRQDAPDVEMNRPHVDLSLKIAAVAPDGNFAGYCGLWYDPGVDFAVVEPLAVAPEYRRLGIGRAVVLEGVNRVAAMGAKRVLVGSSQEFYARIGFRPYRRATIWKEA